MSTLAVSSSPLEWRRIATFFRHNGLSIAALVLFLGSVVGQVVTGFGVANHDAIAHGAATLSLGQYLTSGDFGEALFENWESEFLQMGIFVVLTKYLRQKGSSESKRLDAREEVDADPRFERDNPAAPFPVRRGGFVLAVYQRSLSIALFSLFIASFILHGFTGASKYNEEALQHGALPLSTLQYFGSATFWFESFQNWQSEFLSVAALVLLSIVLRERGSPQSKPVAAPHAETGG